MRLALVRCCASMCPRCASDVVECFLVDVLSFVLVRMVAFKDHAFLVDFHPLSIPFSPFLLS